MNKVDARPGQPATQMALLSSNLGHLTSGWPIALIVASHVMLIKVGEGVIVRCAVLLSACSCYSLPREAFSFRKVFLLLRLGFKATPPSRKLLPQTPLTVSLA
jgi:hypothetical protein